ncbi:MAG: anti-sigma factor family protein [Pyrinomonadaceae bacterium]
MDCEKYNHLVSSYIDEELDSQTNKEMSEHLFVCEGCAKLYEDLTKILEFTEDTYARDDAPPNSQALWCRINNIIETEISAEAEVMPPQHKSLPSRIFGTSFNVSSSQVFASVLCIALISSLVTFLAVRNFSPPPEIHGDAAMQPNLVETMLSKVGFVETKSQEYQRKISEQKSAIAYWQQRVDMRKTQWDAHLQTAYDRNLNEINKVVNDYTQILKENPNDKISSEMLDSALSEKMEFLREFAEL